MKPVLEWILSDNLQSWNEDKTESHTDSIQSPQKIICKTILNPQCQRYIGPKGSFYSNGKIAVSGHFTNMALLNWQNNPWINYYFEMLTRK